MATVGSFDFNKDNLKDVVNNSTQLVEEISLGISNQGTDVGEAIGIFVTIIVYIVLITLIVGILFLVFRFVKSLLARARGLK